MAEITVTPAGPERFSVAVADRGTTHTYAVTAPGAFVRDALGLDSVDGATLIRASFEFLLEREPPSSILSRFSLEDIVRYFPDYPRQIAGRLPGTAGAGP